MKTFPEDLLQQTHPTRIANGGNGIAYRSESPGEKYDVYFSQHALVFVKDGAVIIHQGNRSFMIGQGEAAFLKSNCYGITEMTLGSAQHQSILLFFEEDIINTLIETHDLNSNPKGNTPALIKLIPSAESKLLFEKSMPMNTDESTDQQAAFSQQINTLLAKLLEEDNNLQLALFINTLNSRPKQALDIFMQDQSLLKLPIDVLAKLSGRSLSSFQNDFANVFNESPKTWINRKRLEKAYFYLTHTPDSVQEISQRVGFSNTASFTEAFKKAYNMTPQEVSEKAGQ